MGFRGKQPSAPESGSRQHGDMQSRTTSAINLSPRVCQGLTVCQLWLLSIGCGVGQELTKTEAPAANWAAVAASGDGTLVIGAGHFGTLQISTDGGSTWSPAKTSTSEYEPQRPWTAVAISSDGAQMLAAAESNPLFVSSDSGSTWVKSGRAGAWSAVAVSATGERMLAAEHDGSIAISEDSGASWVDGDAPQKRWRAISGSSDLTRVVAAAEPGPGMQDHGELWVSLDGGKSWRMANAPEQAWQTVASSADGQKMAAAAVGGPIYLSGDSGATWQAAPTPTLRWTAVSCSDDGLRWVAAAEGSIWQSTDGGSEWAALPAPEGQWQTIKSSGDGASVFAAIWNVWPDSPSGIYSFAFAPSLTLKFSGNEAVLSWPASAGDFVLEQRALPGIGAWEQVNATPVMSGGDYTVRLPLTNGGRAYRLAKSTPAQ